MAGDTIKTLSLKPAPFVVSDVDLGRQAAASLRGYVYQIHQSAAAWINLADGDLLCLEVAEDFATILRQAAGSDETMHATQVKRSARSVTLNSPEILQAIATLFRLQVINPSRDVRLTFLTTAAIGAERVARLCSGRAGLTAWHQAAKGGDVEEIRAALLARFRSGPLNQFIRTATKRELRTRLLRALTFVCGQGDWQDIERKNRAALVRLRDEVQATAAMANRAYDAVFAQVVSTIIDSDTRLLDRAALRDCLQAATAIAVPSQVVTNQLLSTKAADPILPLILEATPSAEGLLRFSPHNSRVPFVGRAAEVRALRTFIDAKAAFSWWMLTGDGGMGKTRLARQLCVMLSEQGWRAGFLPLHYGVALEIVTERWEPSLPTLIVVDYALQHIEAVHALITIFARRSRSSCPIRMLLLERDVESSFDQEVLGYDQSDRAFILNTRHDAKPLHLRRLSRAEIWSLVQTCPWRGDNRRVELSATQFVTWLRAVDKAARPLVAMILADSIAEGSRHNAGAELNQHLRELIQRERQMFWPAQLGVSGKPIGATEADEIIALATLTGGFGKARLPAIAKARGRPFDTTLFPACAQAIGKPFSSKRRQLEHMEPDLIGELFALEVLAHRGGNPMLEPPRAWMPIAAWKMSGRAVADFVRRCEQNFPNHPALRSLRITVPGSADSWWSRAKCLAMGDYRAALEMLAKPASTDVAAAVAFGRMIYMLSSIKARDRGVGQMKLLNVVALMWDSYPRNTALPRLWSASVRNFSKVYGATNPEACKELVEKLTVLVRKRRDPSVASDLISATLHLVRHALPRSSAMKTMMRALTLAVPLLKDPTSVAMWGAALVITREKLKELAAAKRVGSAARRDKNDRSGV